eukprot:scaffold2162_cov398-Prasinococcus_capsulatus_cf.AAC.4
MNGAWAVIEPASAGEAPERCVAMGYCSFCTDVMKAVTGRSVQPLTHFGGGGRAHRSTASTAPRGRKLPLLCPIR